MSQRSWWILGGLGLVFVAGQAGARTEGETEDTASELAVSP
jgi:hypothetical protein